MTQKDDAKIKNAVKKHYAGLISEDAQPATCCAPAGETTTAAQSCCSPASVESLLAKSGYAETLGYKKSDLENVPAGAAENTFGCGAPLNHTDIREGDVVLDLGSGAGLDVFLAAKEVGETGKAIGLDMTPEMIAKAEGNAAQMGVKNVEFVLGEMEQIPLKNDSVDWIISNCVINLSPDKPQVFREAHRVLKPGGQLVVSDIAASGLPEKLRQSISGWAACVSGALSEAEYLQAIKDAGFTNVEIVEKVNVSDTMFAEVGIPVAGEIASIKVRATKK